MQIIIIIIIMMMMMMMMIIIIIIIKYLWNGSNKSKLCLRAGKIREHFLSFMPLYLSSRHLCEKVKSEIHRTIILPVVLYGCEACSVA
jgi:hypothetical protein